MPWYLFCSCVAILHFIYTQDFQCDSKYNHNWKTLDNTSKDAAVMDINNL